MIYLKGFKIAIEDQLLQPIILFMGLITILFLSIFLYFLKKEKLHNKLISFIFLCFSFFPLPIVSFLIMEAGKSATYYGVLRAVFIIFSILFGFIPLIFLFIDGILLAILSIIYGLDYKKNKKQSGGLNNEKK